MRPVRNAGAITEQGDFVAATTIPLNYRARRARRRSIGQRLPRMTCRSDSPSGPTTPCRRIGVSPRSRSCVTPKNHEHEDGWLHRDNHCVDVPSSTQAASSLRLLYRWNGDRQLLSLQRHHDAHMNTRSFSPRCSDSECGLPSRSGNPIGAAPRRDRRTALQR